MLSLLVLLLSIPPAARLWVADEELATHRPGFVSATVAAAL